LHRKLSLLKTLTMVTFFRSDDGLTTAVSHSTPFNREAHESLSWLLGGAAVMHNTEMPGKFRGPRREMITPWSTNAVEITQNMGLAGVVRMEQFVPVDSDTTDFDRMLEQVYSDLNQEIFTIIHPPEPVQEIVDISTYNTQEGLALSDDEVVYLEELSARLGRPLTDSEVFGFSQVNSEHCRHKIFNGTFIIDGKEMPVSLFALIRKTTAEHRGRVVSAYKDNVAFIAGPAMEQFAPEAPDKPSLFVTRQRDAVISLKAETHNFPTTVEPFNGAATGTGGEIRDRMAGGKGSLPIAGTAVYITSYPRLDGGRPWETSIPERTWLYQTPADILIKASNGASDFGNKFGQPLICGSLLTFEHAENEDIYGFDKVIMLAGGVGFGYAEDVEKNDPSTDDVIVVMGGDNYRIGMGGGAVSSVATGEFSNSIELNAVQRSNPEMQKRVSNAIRAMVEAGRNPIVSIHDHGAGGHLNSLSELVEASGGTIDVRKLPVGDPTLSAREIIGNESQERMGLIIRKEDFALLKAASERERAPIYAVGHVTGDQHLTFSDPASEKHPIDLHLTDFFGKPPGTILEDTTRRTNFRAVKPGDDTLKELLYKVLQLESVACKDWLTNKVDRSVTGKVAMQQCTGALQLPLNNVAVVALDYRGVAGIATALGHAPGVALIDPRAGSRVAVAESLTNIMWAPMAHGLGGVSLSANWMWPCRNPGEDARLYAAVEAISDFCIALGINIPTGKDSLSMTQKYPDGSRVVCPGTVIVTAVGEVSDIKRCVTPALKPVEGSSLMHLRFGNDSNPLGGSALAQVCNMLGHDTPDIEPGRLASGFALIQSLMAENQILAGHDISAGGLITALLEMAFPTTHAGFVVDLKLVNSRDLTSLLFNEQPGVVIQVTDPEIIMAKARAAGIPCTLLGSVTENGKGQLTCQDAEIVLDIAEQRNCWYRTSYLMDQRQCGEHHASERYKNYQTQPLEFHFPQQFSGTYSGSGINPDRPGQTGIRAGIIREKGVNGDREMAWAMHLAGFDVRDIHMTDLISGRETLDDLNFIVFVGGFSNSDVLGSAKGWAGAFLFNPTAKATLDRFFARPDTLSLGVCNGCQLMVELGLIKTSAAEPPKMLHNDSGKFESAFLTIDILPNHSVMLGALAGSRLGIWVAHGEGKFSMPGVESDYHIPAKYTYSAYPGNPNGSDFSTAAIASPDGRHLAIMPHLERSVYPWNWAHYPEGRSDQVSPWMEAFVNAARWVAEHTGK
jgi:phosphoribosylformylglycinamidine synthase